MTLRKAHRIVAVPQLTPSRVGMLDTLSELYKKCDDDDETFMMHAIFLLVVDRHGLEEARRLFAYMGTPKFVIDLRANLIASLYKTSGPSKSQFSRQFAATKDAPSPAGVRRSLDRALRKIANAEKKASLGHSSKKVS